MGIYINNKVIMQKEKEKFDEVEKAMIMLQLAEKEKEIAEVKFENAFIILEIANMKGGM